jgi:hypothetical protein
VARARRLRESGDTGAAARVLDELVARPDPPADALLERCRLAIAAQDAGFARSTGSRAIGALRAARRDDDAVTLYRDLRDRFGRPPLTDAALLDVAHSAIALGSGTIVTEVVNTLIELHPESPLVSQALWEVALLQERVGRPDRMERTLRRLIERDPLDPLADAARARLIARWDGSPGGGGPDDERSGG